MTTQELIDYLDTHQQVLISQRNYNQIVRTYNNSKKTKVDINKFNQAIKPAELNMSNSRIKANKLYKIYIESLKNKLPKQQQQIQQQTPPPSYTESPQQNSENSQLISLY